MEVVRAEAPSVVSVRSACVIRGDDRRIIGAGDGDRQSPAWSMPPSLVIDGELSPGEGELLGRRRDTFCKSVRGGGEGKGVRTLRLTAEALVTVAIGGDERLARLQVSVSASPVVDTGFGNAGDGGGMAAHR